MLSPVQFLDKVADSPVASMTGAWGRQYRNCGLAVAGSGGVVWRWTGGWQERGRQAALLASGGG